MNMVFATSMQKATSQDAKLTRFVDKAQGSKHAPQLRPNSVHKTQNYALSLAGNMAIQRLCSEHKENQEETTFGFLQHLGIARSIERLIQLINLGSTNSSQCVQH